MVRSHRSEGLVFTEQRLARPVVLKDLNLEYVEIYVLSILLCVTKIKNFILVTHSLIYGLREKNPVLMLLHSLD